MNTPWGKSDSKIQIERGFSWVGTPGHGGFALAKGFARKHLSIAAQQQGELRYGYFFFEEDVDYAIVAWELGGFDLSVPNTRWMPNADLTFYRDNILSVLSLYRADYLLARNVTPLTAEYARFLAQKEEDALRAAKSPDLIIAAWGDWADWVPAGKVGVVTAAGTYFLIDSEDYKSGDPWLSSYSNAIATKWKL